MERLHRREQQFAIGFAGHGAEAFAGNVVVGDGLAVELLKLRLVVEQINVVGAPFETDRSPALLWGDMRQAGNRGCPLVSPARPSSRCARESGERREAQAVPDRPRNSRVDWKSFFMHWIMSGSFLGQCLVQIQDRAAQNGPRRMFGRPGPRHADSPALSSCVLDRTGRIVADAAPIRAGGFSFLPRWWAGPAPAGTPVMRSTSCGSF
jgi:hypothetical protein